ncbi:MAG: FHA domain-containing protein [Chloroflexi bacterium]|nr:FHA domain-containing protein [Chloroflexota bacterium]
MLVLSFLLLTVPVVLAQSGSSAIVNYVNLVENGSAQALEVYFTLFDAAGGVISDRQPTAASLVFEDGKRVDIDPSRIQRPGNPVFVALVLDASGSMRDAVDEMKQAAKDAVNNAPPEAAFAVYQFNERSAEGAPVLRALQGYTLDDALILDAIDRLEVQNRGTCLYDATVEALTSLQFVPPISRRAVILFTDGRDELVSGGELDPCSENSLEAVLTAATAIGQRTPIYAIGLQGNSPVARTELESIAAASGGIARFGAIETLPTLFQEIMRALSSQLVVAADVCLESGPTRATLNLSLERELLEPKGLIVNVAGNCFLPTATPTATATATATATFTPLPLVLRAEAFDFQLDPETASFIVERSGDGTIAAYRVTITDAQGGNLLLELPRVNFDASLGARQVISFSTSDLPNAGIDVVVSAVDELGNTLARSQPLRATISRPTPTPTPTYTASPTLAPVDIQVDGVQQPDLNSDTVLLNLTVAQQDRITDFQISVIEDSSNRRVETFSPQLEETVQLSFEGLRPNIDYRIRIVAQTTEGGTVSREVTFFFEKPPTPTPTYTPTPSPSTTLTPTRTPSPVPTTPPVVVEVVGLVPADDWSSIALQLRVEEVGRITDDLEIRIIDSQGFDVRTLRQPVSEQIFVPTQDLNPGQEYRIVVRASIFGEPPVNAERTFTFDPPRTPTFTPSHTPTSTASPTPTVTPGVALSAPRLDNDTSNLTLDLNLSNQSMIQELRVQVIGSDGIVRFSENRRLTPDNLLRIPFANQVAGEYTIDVTALDSSGIALSHTSVTISYTPPPTPAPTSAPSPIELFVERVGTTAQENPIVLALVVVVLLLLLLVFIWAIRRLTGGGRRRQDTLKAPLLDDRPTGAFIQPGGPSDTADLMDSSGLTESTRPRGDDGTKVAEYDMEKTKVEMFSHVSPLPDGVSAHLYVQESEDRSMKGREFPIATREFRIGRKVGDLTFPRDEYMSREHAQIIYESGEFYLIDLGSAGGTYLDSKKVEPNVRTRLSNNKVITLGSRTKIQFIRD